MTDYRDHSRRYRDERRERGSGADGARPSWRESGRVYNGSGDRFAYRDRTPDAGSARSGRASDTFDGAGGRASTRSSLDEGFSAGSSRSYRQTPPRRGDGSGSSRDRSARGGSSRASYPRASTSAPARSESARSSYTRTSAPARGESTRASSPRTPVPARGASARGQGSYRTTSSRRSASARTSPQPPSATREALSTARAGLDDVGSRLGARAGDVAAGILDKGVSPAMLLRAVVVVAVAVLALLLVRAVACSRQVGEQQYIQVAAGGMPAVPQGEVTVAPRVARVTLSAVGDNLIHDSLNRGADLNAGVADDGKYDFTPMYEQMAQILADHDINFIDMETVLGGDDLGISGYPEFNTPECIAEQLASCGWNLVTCATNHAWDMGLDGVLNNCNVWARQEDVVMAGTYASATDRSTIRTFEREGITFAFLAYTDVINNVELPITPEYAVAVADQTRMTADIEAAKQLADVVIVAMSWGDEDSSAVSASQEEYAQLLADAGVDLVIGFGPHVIQPVEWLEGKDAQGGGAGHRTLVVYSLGNFISNQMDYPENVEGCFTCAFELDRTTGAIELVDPQWIPLVNHIEGDYHRVFPLSSYTAELAAKHDVLGDLDDPLGYVRSRTTSTLNGSDVEVVGLN